MTDVVSIGQRAQSLEVSPTFAPYSKVILHVSDSMVHEVGDDTGRTLEIDNPFGTQAMAQNILNSLAGFQYQPFTADNAHLDPAAEIGDAANLRGVYGGIYSRKRSFGRLMTADIAAPKDEEINHEYKFESPQERKFARQINDVKASLIIANGRIDATVTKTGGSSSSFGWSLTDNAHRWYANGQEVMAVTASGLTVKGSVVATGGKIGNFNISASAIWNNLSSFGGTQSSGVYIGTNGIQLGQRFKVDSSGNVTATRLTVDTLVIGGSSVSAATLNSRANSAYTSTSQGGYCYTGASYGNAFYNATKEGTSQYPSRFTCGSLMCHSSLSAYGQIYANSGISISGHTAYWSSITVGGITRNILTY